MTSRSDRPSPGTEPQTEAGRALRDSHELRDTAAHPHPDYVLDCWLCRSILAIEAEARAALLAEVREGVEGLRGNPFQQADAPDRWIDRKAVLALLDTLADGGPTDG